MLPEKILVLSPHLPLLEQARMIGVSALGTLSHILGKNKVKKTGAVLRASLEWFLLLTGRDSIRELVHQFPHPQGSLQS